MTTRVIRNIAQIDDLSDNEKQRLVPVTAEFEFRVSAYYAGLIDWSDPDDPLRRIVLPIAVSEHLRANDDGGLSKARAFHPRRCFGREPESGRQELGVRS